MFCCVDCLPLALIGSIDYAVLILYMIAMLAIGFYFSNQQHTTQDFFLAGRSLGWFPIGMSLMATLISALSYTGVPGQGYEVGLKVLAIPVAIWATAPVVLGFAVPLYRSLNLFSIYEYLEMRFDARTRLAATVLFAVWRLLWLGGVIYAPCKAISLTAGWNVPDWVLIVILGIVTTAYTFLGGMKAVIWTDVIQGVTMLLGVVVVIVGVWAAVDGGPGRVWEVAQGLKRTAAVDTTFSFTQRWSIWAFLPHYILAMLSFYLADQITAQRFLTAKSVPAARQSFVLNCLVLTLLFPGLTYIGLCLLTYFHDHPQHMRANWVANVDALTKQPIRGKDGLPLLNPKERSHELIPVNLPQLVREQRILSPNREEPFTDPAEFTDPATGLVDIEKLAKRKPNVSRVRGELILRKGAAEELLPAFVADRLLPGIAGLILAALLAASMSSVDSGLNSIVTLLIKDFHERFGWGERWLANRVGKQPQDLNDSDRLHLAQPLTLVIGIAATISGILVGRIGDVFDIMLGVVNTFGAPLLGIFLLGMFTRRTTAAAAFIALLAGTLFTTYVMAIGQWTALRAFWPLSFTFSDVWTITLGTAFTLVVGYGLSFVLGRANSTMELRGLVYGNGRPGEIVPRPKSAIVPPDAGNRWR